MPSHTSEAAMPEEKKGSMSQISIAPALPSRTSLAQLMSDRPRSTWYGLPATGAVIWSWTHFHVDWGILAANSAPSQSMP